MLKQAEDIFAEYVNSPTYGKLFYNSMIDAYAKCSKQEKAYLLYKQATEEGHDLGAVGISLAVNALTNEGMATLRNINYFLLLLFSPCGYLTFNW